MSDALVVANRDDPDPGHVGERLVQRGYRLRTVLREDGVPSSVAAAGSPRLALLLGSAWSVVTPDDAGALAAETDLVRDALRSGVPVLGLCYGAQVVAHATGGRVLRAPVPEVGLVEVESADPAAVPAGPWPTFHTDVVEAPPGATVVARNACGVQAFVLPGVLGVQFHPEVGPNVFASWTTRLPGIVAAAGQDAGAVVAAARAGAAASRAAAHVLVDAFLARAGAGDA